MTKIRPNLYLGSWQSVNAKDLEQNKITAILCCDHNLVPDLHSIREKYKWICVHLHDNELPNPSHVLEISANILDQLLCNNETVLVHCIAGSNRAPSVVCKYLTNEYGGGWDENWNQLRKLRAAVGKYSKVMQYLK